MLSSRLFTYLYLRYRMMLVSPLSKQFGRYLRHFIIAGYTQYIYIVGKYQIH
jgi:hypothetical protein